MKKILFVALVALAAAAQAELKVAAVNMMELVNFHPRHAGDAKLLKGKESDYQKELDRRREEIEAIEKEFRDAQQEAQNPLLTDKARRDALAKIEEIQKRGMAAQNDYRAKAQELQTDLQKLEADLLRAVSDDIREKLGQFAKDAGYDLIFDVVTTPYVADALNVTDEVLKAMGVDGPKARAEAKREADAAKDKADAAKGAEAAAKK